MYSKYILSIMFIKLWVQFFSYFYSGFENWSKNNIIWSIIWLSDTFKKPALNNSWFSIWALVSRFKIILMILFCTTYYLSKWPLLILGYQEEQEASKWHCIITDQSAFLYSKCNMSLYIYIKNILNFFLYFMLQYLYLIGH